MWADFLHHITLHFPIVLTMGLAAIGLYSLRRTETPELQTIMRWGGWAALVFTTLAALSGIAAAPGPLGGDGSTELTHHRDLAITAWCTIALAAWSYDHGLRTGVRDWRAFATGLWCVAVFAVIGTGHWGGATLHHDVVPW